MPANTVLTDSLDSRSESRVLAAEDVVQPTSENFEIESLIVPAGQGYGTHFHSKDQLSWMAGGAMTVSVGAARWHLRREHFVWIPAGMLHEMVFTEPGEVINVYTDVGLRPEGGRWDRPGTLGVDALSAAILWHLVGESRGLARNRLCLLLLRDLLRTAEQQHDALALPSDPRARAVAERLVADPGDPRELAQWATELGVSARTLSRAFLAETGSSFRAWRQLVRMNAAAEDILRGASVSLAAERVGYGSASAFIAAFRDRFGTTPVRYARAQA